MIVLTVAALVVLDPLRQAGAPDASSPARSTPASLRPSAAVGALELEVETTGSGPTFPVSERFDEPTADIAQSKLWVHDGLWWGALLAEGTDELRIHRLDWGGGRWVDTGVRIAPRASLPPDVVADGNQVWIATGDRDPRGRDVTSLYRYTYDPELARYALDADFPVTIAPEQVRSMTMARDADGRLWAAWIRADRVVIARTNGNDLIWDEAHGPPVSGTGLPIDAVTLVSYGDTVALLWSNQNRDAVHLAVPTVADEERWEHEEVAVDGLQQADDDLHAVVEATATGPRIYAVIRSSADGEGGASAGDPQMLLLVREPDGPWTQYLAGALRDRHTRPIVVLDDENDVLYVIATSPSAGGEIYYKATRTNDISFASGVGSALIQDPDGPELNNATSTKQLLGSATGLVVLASDARTGKYFHAAARLDGSAAPSLAVPSAEPAPAWLLNDTFDPYPPGSPLAGRWDLRSTGSSAFTIEDVAGDRRVAHAASDGDESRVRMCKDFTPVDGVVKVEAEFMAPRVGTSGVTVTLIRHAGASADVRLHVRGVYAYFDGATQVRTVIPWAVGTWYRSVVTLNTASGTYDWEVRRSSDDALVLLMTGASVGVAPEEPASTVCLQSPDALEAGPTLLVDRVRVSG